MILETAGHAVMISGFVLVMMLLIEYLNVLTRGKWDQVISRWTWAQSVFGSFMGATPGCLGAFAMASLYIHRVATVGALTATMIATCGDEAFVMLALFPGKALMIFVFLFAMGAVLGIAVDVALKFRKAAPAVHAAEYGPTHAEEVECIHFAPRRIIDQWRRCSPHRGWLTALLVLFMAGVLSGKVGHHHLGVDGAQREEAHVEAGAGEVVAAEHAHDEHGLNWVQVTLLLATAFALFVVVTVPEHFLDEHLWNHIVRVHLLRIVLWTFAAMVVTEFLLTHLDLERVISGQKLPVLVLACLVGLIPTSGPHLMFVTLYAQGAVPLSTLLASCVVQDGHGMIPVLAHSRPAFVAIKGAKFVLGLALGLVGNAMGW